MAGGEHYVPIKMIAKEPPWLLLICLGVAAVLIVGIAIVVGFARSPGLRLTRDNVPRIPIYREMLDELAQPEFNAKLQCLRVH